MAERNDRRLFADGMIYKCGEWVTTYEWIAHESLDLPEDWVECALESDRFRAGIARYLIAAIDSEPVEFGALREIVEDGFSWNYEAAVDVSVSAINADIRTFFEALTPGAEWRLSWTSMKARNANPVPKGPMFSRVTPDGRVLFMVAGHNPEIAKAAAA